MQRIVTFLNSTTLKKAVLYFISAYLFLIYGYALLKIPVNGDGGFYLSVADAIVEGTVPYKDLYVSYPPVGLYFFAFIRLITGNTPVYWPYLLSVILLHSINAVLIHGISRKICSNYSAILLGLSYLIIVFHIEGVHIMLEPFVVFFSLLATKIYFQEKRTSKQLLLCGIYCGLSFLSKQYGLGSFLLLLFFYSIEVFTRKLNISSLFIFTSGFFLSIILCLGFLIALDINLYHLKHQLFGVSYGQHSLHQLSSYSIEFFKETNFLWLIILITIFFIWQKKIFQLRLLYLFAAVLGFMLQFYFQPFKHYGIIMVPFLLLILAVFFHELNKTGFFKLYPFILVAIILLFVQKNARTFRHNINYWDRKLQYADAALIHSIMGQTKAYLPDHPELYFILDIEPVDAPKFGFSFSNYLPNKEMEYLLAQTNFVIISTLPEALNAYHDAGFFTRFHVRFQHPRFIIFDKK